MKCNTKFCEETATYKFEKGDLCSECWERMIIRDTREKFPADYNEVKEIPKGTNFLNDFDQY